MEKLKELHLHRLFTVSKILPIELEVECDNRLLYSCDAVGSRWLQACKFKTKQSVASGPCSLCKLNYVNGKDRIG